MSTEKDKNELLGIDTNEPTTEAIIEKRDYKEANQIGIIGFIFAMVFPAYKMLLNVQLDDNMFNDVSSENVNLNLFWQLAFFSILALVFSIIGVAKNGKRYQKGIAVFGLVLNSLFLINIVVELSTHQSGGVEPSSTSLK